MPHMDKLSSYRTTIASKNGNICVTYVKTVIVEFDHENIILRSGGYETATTKRKMNQAARQFALGYGVFQENYEWFVRLPAADGKPNWDKSNIIPFEDGMQIARPNA